MNPTQAQYNDGLNTLPTPHNSGGLPFTGINVLDFVLIGVILFGIGWYVSSLTKF